MLKFEMERQLKDPNFWITVVESMKEGLMVVDAEGNVVYFNKAAEEITGYSRHEVMGNPCIILDSDTCVALTDHGRERSCDLFREGQISNKRCRIRGRDGGAIYLIKNATVIRDEGGELIGAVETMTNITSIYMKEIELEDLKQELRKEYWLMGLLGNSRPMQELFEQIRNAAESEAPVLITGESGTGKNLVALAVHALSRRSKERLIAMNCASLNENLLESELFGHKRGAFTGAISDRMGRFEAAHNGTILLDEIGDMPTVMQAKLLRVLEEKVVERVGDQKPIPVNVRLISATNQDLDGMVAQGKFREDLFYRVNSISIRVPPLRERAADIPMLAFHYLKKVAAVNKKDIRMISPDALEILSSHGWPGNVRQLISAIEYSAITCKGDTVEVSNLPDYVRHVRPQRGESQLDREKLCSTLALYKGNRTLTAKHLGVSKVTLWKKMKKFGVE